MTAHVIAVRPNRQLCVINEVLRVGYEIIKVIRSGGVLGLRNSDAFMRKVGTRPNDKLRKNPTPSHDVERDHRVTIIMNCASSAKRLEKRIASCRPEKQRASCFIENSETGIVPLDILFCANSPVGIRRIASRDEPGKPNTSTTLFTDQPICRR